MIKIGCVYTPKVNSVAIAEYPKHFQVAELGNTFYRAFSQKDITTLGKLPKKNKDFEFTLRVNRFISHKYQFQYDSLREKALEMFSTMKSMAEEVNCNKLLFQTHFSLEYNDNFFKNLDDFFNSVSRKGVNIFWEFRGLGWKSRETLPKLQKKFADLNIGHSIDLLFSKPINIVKEGIIYTKLHGFGVKYDQYLHSLEDLMKLIEEMNALLENNKEVYAVFANEEMYNDAIFLKKVLEAGQTGEMDLEKAKSSLRRDFGLNFSFKGQNLQVVYAPPYAIQSEKDAIKISPKVMENMDQNIAGFIDLVNKMNGVEQLDEKFKGQYFNDLRKLGEYFLKYLLGDRVNYRYRLTSNETLVIENDESSLNYPYEMIFDKWEFVCLKNKCIRKFIENDIKYPSEIPKLSKKQKIRCLFINRTSGESSNQPLINFKSDKTEMVLLEKGGAQDIQNALGNGYDIISYIGNAQSNEGGPALRWGKSAFSLEEVVNFMKTPPKLFIIGNISQQQKMGYLKDVYATAIPFVKAGCNFMTNFISLSKDQLFEFYREFYPLILNGEDLPSALKKTREKIFERYWGLNPSWFSFTLFGDERFKIEGGI
ncbi:MAG: DUF72 domain-containing protein [Candidatus Helarchaeota archaeon]|nr:DUF72 domain-containing protein [Candidatus Helarchaeota archaeon]